MTGELLDDRRPAPSAAEHDRAPDAAPAPGAPGRGPAGLPLTPGEAWGLLDVLEGGSARWLSPEARDEVRAVAAHLAGAPAARWRAVLADRSLVVHCWAGPQALTELDRAPGEVLYIARCAPGSAGAVEVYADTDAWMQVQPRVLMGAEVRGEMNLVVRVPQGLWPFTDGAVGPCVLAADALEHPDAHVVAEGESTLNQAAAALAADG